MTVFLKNHYDKIVAIVRNTIIRDQEEKNKIFVIILINKWAEN